jgi:hypothetical protein
MKGVECDQATFRRLADFCRGSTVSSCLMQQPHSLLLLTILLFNLEDSMIETKIEKAMKPIPVPYEEFEAFPKHVEEFFDLVARRPFELLARVASPDLPEAL